MEINKQVYGSLKLELERTRDSVLKSPYFTDDGMRRPREREQLASSHTLLRHVFGSQPQLCFFFGHSMALLLFHVFSFCLLKINRNEKENQNAH